jgi:Domain of unknown function (DUF802)
MNRIFFAVAFAIGLVAVGWVGIGFISVSPLALAMTCAIGAVYVLGAVELWRLRSASDALAASLGEPMPTDAATLDGWLTRLHPSLRQPVRQRIEGERTALPAPALTPYLVGLLVMLGMLGTFLGMVVTFQGAVFALEGSTDLQAIRGALAAPIKGLGLSFGTSVAGVAASAMLGLMSALCRRERMALSVQLDARIASGLRALSGTRQRALAQAAQAEHAERQRQEGLQALLAVQALQADALAHSRSQAQALPDMLGALRALAEGLERRQQHLSEQLLTQQAAFHDQAAAVHAELARSVGQALQDSLTASAQVAGDSLRPVVQEAMQAIAETSAQTHQRLVDHTQAQFEGLSARFEGSARTVAEGWKTALQAHAQTSEHLSTQLGGTLSGFNEAFAQRADAVVAAVTQSASQAQAAQAEADQRKLAAWTDALAAQSAQWGAEWQRVGAQTLQQQEAVCRALEATAQDIAERTRVQATQTLDGVAQLLAQSQALVQARAEAESQWATEHAARVNELASLWRSEIGALRADEAARGDAAVDRLAALQTAVTQHLATLGAALEAPMTRLMQTAAEVPQAASEVIAQLRTEMAQLSERDTHSLHERAAVMDQIRTLLATINQASGEQRAAIEALAASAASVMQEASRQFADTLGLQASKTEHLAAHVVSSAIELSTLGESFRHGTETFSATNGQLADVLQRIEGTLQQSMARSDEQLAYYVAQAREVIDLSISAQQGIVEDLRRLHAAAPGKATPGLAA